MRPALQNCKIGTLHTDTKNWSSRSRSRIRIDVVSAQQTINGHVSSGSRLEVARVEAKWSMEKLWDPHWNGVGSWAPCGASYHFYRNSRHWIWLLSQYCINRCFKVRKCTEIISGHAIHQPANSTNHILCYQMIHVVVIHQPQRHWTLAFLSTGSDWRESGLQPRLGLYPFSWLAVNQDEGNYHVS